MKKVTSRYPLKVYNEKRPPGFPGGLFYFYSGKVTGLLPFILWELDVTRFAEEILSVHALVIGKQVPDCCVVYVVQVAVAGVTGAVHGVALLGELKIHALKYHGSSPKSIPNIL